MSEKHSVLRGGTRPPGLPSASFPNPHVDVETRGLGPHEIRTLTREPDVVAVAPVMPLKLEDPVGGAVAGGVAWGVPAVGAFQSPWDGNGTVVALLDTGIDAGHPAFAGVDLVQRDFTGGDNGDRHGHGTHCAGIIFGRDVDGTRIGLARGVRKALIARIIGDDGEGGSDGLFQAVQWALSEGAHVIMSSVRFDFPALVSSFVENGWPPDLALSAALDAYLANARLLDALVGLVEARGAFTSGAVLVAPAGNDSRRELRQDLEVAPRLPAAASGILSVGALEASEGGLRVAPFSNAFAELSAPGVQVLSARAGGGLHALSGTATAAAHVAGVALQWWQALEAAGAPPSARIIRARLLGGARTDLFDNSVPTSERGAGCVTSPA